MKVGPLVVVGSAYEIDVTVRNRAHALATASVIQGEPEPGGIRVKVVVRTSKGQTISGLTPANGHQLAALEEAALDGNPYFKRVETRASSSFTDRLTVYPIFSRSVVQFYNDNLADYSGNTTLVTADAFRDVLNSELGGIAVSPSTASH